MWALFPIGAVLLIFIGLKVATGDNKFNKGQSAEIVCHFFYRAKPATAKGETGQFTIRVPLAKGGVPEIDLGITETVRFDDLTCEAGANYNALTIHFYGSDRMENISNLLYQFDRKPANQFGGHGFTGLHYIHDPVTGAELQFWAVVKDK